MLEKERPEAGEAAGRKVLALRALVRPYDHTYELYQRYFRRALQSAGGPRYRESGSRPRRFVLRGLDRVKTSYRLGRALGPTRVAWVCDRLASRLRPEPALQNPVGAYDLELDGWDQGRFAVDSLDSPEIMDPVLAGECSVYFKTNCSALRQYPPNVRPLPNANPLVVGHLNALRRLRGAQKQYDLLAFIRVWGGHNEVEGIEHNVQVFRALSRIRGRKLLLAYLVAGDIPSTRKRLEALGVVCQTQPMGKKELWALTAASRVSVVRHGMHHCIPWRMTDTLAMGACPLLDYDTPIRWPEPLTPNVHYLSLGLEFGRSPGESEWRELGERTEQAIHDRSRVAEIGDNNARYFDDHLDPRPLGRHMLGILERVGVGAARGAPVDAALSA